LLHCFVVEESGNSVGRGKTRFLPQHFAAGLDRLRQGDDRVPGFGQGLANLPFQCRFTGAGSAADIRRRLAPLARRP
jgi:hypothetical protein